ncbi:protein SLX4IP [Hypanus sabinus]|uniref:protein SLX4IP n=1 Tax=Hypanus sabinus TaxID=79690 RepID=UPI0028C49BAD|nr:protein SLX4IP [Hypanus sabinus]
MSSNKFVLKCGNFAVLVDPHILPQGTNKDTSWFTEHHKEEISALLKENIDLRIKQYLEARKRGNTQTKPKKELTPNSPVYIKGQNFRIAAYFMKRHANLRCVTEQKLCGLTMLPDRFVVCLTPCEAGPKKRMAEEQMIITKHGASEYFTGESEMKEPCNVSASVQKKKEALKQIVKKSCCTKMENCNKADSGDFLIKAQPGVTEDEQNVAQPFAGFNHEIQDINTGRGEDCMNSVQSKLLLPAIKLEKYINERQPAQQNCQQQPQSIEQLKAGLKNIADNSESALQGLNQNEANEKVLTKRRRVFSQNGANTAVKIISGERPATSIEVTMEMKSPESLRKPMKKKTQVKHNSHSERSVKGKPDSLVHTSRDAGGYLFSTGNSPQDFCHVNKHKKKRLTVWTNSTIKSEVAPSSPSGFKSQNSDTILIKDESEKENMPRKSRIQRLRRVRISKNDNISV